MIASNDLRGSTLVAFILLIGAAGMFFYRASLLWRGDVLPRNGWSAAASAFLGSAFFLWSLEALLQGDQFNEALGMAAAACLIGAVVAMVGSFWFRRRHPTGEAPHPAAADAGAPSGTGEDPGWPEALGTVTTIAFLPVIGVLRQRRALQQGARAPLVQLRILYLTFLIALFLFAFVLSLTSLAGNNQPWVPIAVAGIGVISVVAARWSSRHRLLFVPARGVPPAAPTSLEQLGAAYRTRMFLGIAYAQSAALFGFTGAFIYGALWVYLLGLAFSLTGHWFVAPSQRNIEMDRVRLREQGVSLDLVAALQVPPPPRTR